MDVWKIRIRPKIDELFTLRREQGIYGKGVNVALEDENILYSTGCPRCRILKEKLDRHGIAYREVTDVNEIMQAGFDAVPVLVTHGVALDFVSAVKWADRN